MLKKLLIYNVQVLILVLETLSNLIQPEYSIKIFNTENVIFSLGNVDDDNNDDLEIIKNYPGSSGLAKKLHDFHKYVNLVEKTERPKLKESKSGVNELYDLAPFVPAIYPESLYEVAANNRHPGMLEGRKKKKRRKHRLKRKVPEKRNEVQKWKREVTEPPDIGDVEEYDYAGKEYAEYVEKSQKDGKAFKYSDEGKPEESVKDVVNRIVDLKTPKNCTNMTGIGLQAMECIVKNFQDGVFDRNKMLSSLGILILVWIGIYLAIALPLWCAKGWCCCCCRCAFCFPTRTVKEIQKYVAQNPPGTYRNSKGVVEHYKPTQRETELYERIRRSIAEF